MLTRRQAIMQLLEEDWFSLQEIAFHYRVELKEIVKDFRHIEHTVKGSGKVLLEKPAQCKSCGFLYKGRKKFKTPSKCPECRHERIAPAEFKIEEAD